jgi:hypothetical protein
MYPWYVLGRSVFLLCVKHLRERHRGSLRSDFIGFSQPLERLPGARCRSRRRMSSWVPLYSLRADLTYVRSALRFIGECMCRPWNAHWCRHGRQQRFFGKQVFKVFRDQTHECCAMFSLRCRILKEFSDPQKFQSIDFANLQNSFRHLFVFSRSAIRSFGRAVPCAAGLRLGGARLSRQSRLNPFGRRSLARFSACWHEGAPSPDPAKGSHGARCGQG